MKQNKEFNEAIDFAIQDSEPAAFLTAWREGDWETLRNEWPEFKVPELNAVPDDLLMCCIPKETMALAKQIVDMPVLPGDRALIAEWAGQLAADIALAGD